MAWKIILVIAIIYVIYNKIIIDRINRLDTLNEPQRKLNIIMLWIVPFIWGFIVLSITKPSKTAWTDKKKLSKRQKYMKSGYSSYTEWGE